MGNEEYYRSDMHWSLVLSPYASVISLAGLGVCAGLYVVPFWAVGWGAACGFGVFVSHVLKWIKRRDAFQSLAAICVMLLMFASGNGNSRVLGRLTIGASFIATYSTLLFFNRRRIREAFAKGASRETPA